MFFLECCSFMRCRPSEQDGRRLRVRVAVADGRERGVLRPFSSNMRIECASFQTISDLGSQRGGCSRSAVDGDCLTKRANALYEPSIVSRRLWSAVAPMPSILPQ
uniref:Uncharacterized protein n=1 Tax=Plectus sambesii TaxID=2011161 RepID=A0A914UY07_9BILA